LTAWKDKLKARKFQHEQSSFDQILACLTAWKDKLKARKFQHEQSSFDQILACLTAWKDMREREPVGLPFLFKFLPKNQTKKWLALLIFSAIIKHMKVSTQMLISDIITWTMVVATCAVFGMCLFALYLLSSSFWDWAI